jgi:hypothetical protein
VCFSQFCSGAARSEVLSLHCSSRFRFLPSNLSRVLCLHVQIVPQVLLYRSLQLSLISSAQDFLLPPAVFVFPAGEFPSRQGCTPVLAAGEKSRSSGGHPVSFPRWSLSRSAKSFSSSARSASWFPIFVATRSASPGFDSRRRRCAPLSLLEQDLGFVLRFASGLFVRAEAQEAAVPRFLFSCSPRQRLSCFVFQLTTTAQSFVRRAADFGPHAKRSSAWFPLRPSHARSTRSGFSLAAQGPQSKPANLFSPPVLESSVCDCRRDLLASCYAGPNPVPAHGVKTRRDVFIVLPPDCPRRSRALVAAARAGPC